MTFEHFWLKIISSEWFKWSGMYLVFPCAIRRILTLFVWLRWIFGRITSSPLLFKQAWCFWFLRSPPSVEIGHFHCLYRAHGTLSNFWELLVYWSCWPFAFRCLSRAGSSYWLLRCSLITPRRDVKLHHRIIRTFEILPIISKTQSNTFSYDSAYVMVSPRILRNYLIAQNSAINHLSLTAVQLFKISIIES